MARRKISNELWAALEPLIPVFTPSPKGGRRRTVSDRAAFPLAARSKAGSYSGDFAISYVFRKTSIRYIRFP
jgi:transposase